jgi:hypothetical protein
LHQAPDAAIRQEHIEETASAPLPDTSDREAHRSLGVSSNHA